MKAKNNYLISRFILKTFPLIALLSYFLFVYKFKLFSLSNFLELAISSFAIVLSLYTFFANQRDLHNHKIEEILKSSGFQEGDELSAEAKKGEIKLRRK